jgi:hypothetical protein
MPERDKILGYRKILFYCAGSEHVISIYPIMYLLAHNKTLKTETRWQA